jgi:hypothetical protein
LKIVAVWDGHLPGDGPLYYAGGWWAKDIERAKRFPDRDAFLIKFGDMIKKYGDAVRAIEVSK